MTKTVVALLDALEAGLCKDRGAVIADVDVWYTDYIWGEEDENHDYKSAGDVLRAARALQTQTLKDEINMMSGRLKGVEQDLRIIKTKLGAATPEETQAVEKNLKKKEEEQKIKAKEVKRSKEINKAGKKVSLVAKAEEEQKERLVTMTEKEKEATKTI